MTRTQKWSVGTAVAVVLILAAGWLLLVSPKRADAADLQAKAETQQQQNAQLASAITQLKAQQQQLPAKQAELATIRQQLPQTPALPPLIRSLTSIASSAGITVVSLSPAPPAKPVTAGPATAAGTAPVATTTAPDGSQLQVINVTMQVEGNYYNVERFLGKLETLKRSVLVTGFTMVPGSSTGAAATVSVGASPSLKVDLSARVFMSSVPPPDPTATPAPTTAPTAPPK